MNVDWEVYRLEGSYDFILRRMLPTGTMEYLHTKYWNGIRVFESLENAQVAADKLNTKK